MTNIYDPKYWKTPCPKVSCKKKPCCCGLRYVFIPASLESEATPEKGAFSNAVVEYESTGAIYVYSSDGIPVQVTSSDPGELEEEIKAIAKRLANETTARVEADERLEQGLNNKQEKITQDNKLNADLVSDTSSTNKFATAEELSKIGTALQPDDINRSVVDDLDVGSNPSTVSVWLDASKVNLKTGATSSKTVPLPVSSSTQAGVMNSATFNAVASNTDNINALLNGAVAVGNLSATPTQAELTTAWQGATGLTTLINRAQIYDTTNSKIWTYYTNSSTWYEAPAGGQITINTFTNQSEGTILGSTNIGQIFAESDGTGSVNGWDALSSAVSDNTNNKLAVVNLTASGGITKTTTGSGSATAVDLSITDGGIGIDKLNKAALLDLFYPVGSYYETSNTDFNPNTAWGGTWVEDTWGRVTVAYQDNNPSFDQVGEVGGLTETRHAFYRPPINSHNAQNANSSYVDYVRARVDSYLSAGGSSSLTLNEINAFVGGDLASDGGIRNQTEAGFFQYTAPNLQPYIVVKRWHRVA